MPTGTCPECEADVHVDTDADKGETVDCEECRFTSKSSDSILSNWTSSKKKMTTMTKTRTNTRQAAVGRRQNAGALTCPAVCLLLTASWPDIPAGSVAQSILAALQF